VKIVGISKRSGEFQGAVAEPKPSSDKPDVLLAQALGEYGGLSSIVFSIQSAWLAAEEQISRIDSSTWAVVGLAALGLFFLWNRR
jgi:hypothetical protein